MISQMHLPQDGVYQKNKEQKKFKKSIKWLFNIAVFGQWFFVAYIVIFFGRAWLSGDYSAVNESLYQGFLENDRMGNFALAIHLFLAAIITFAGPIQFFEKLRARFPAFHQWNGRIYFVTAIVISLAGLYMIYMRGAAGSEFTRLGNTLNAILIIWFSVMAWRKAMQRNFAAHKIWALRTFLAVSGVWFFRVGYGIWMLATGFTMPGSNSTLTGSYDIFLAFGHAIIPLLILELYFYVKRVDQPHLYKYMFWFQILLNVVLFAGLTMIIAFFWSPHMF